MVRCRRCEAALHASSLPAPQPGDERGADDRPHCSTRRNPSDVLWCHRCEARPSGTISQSPRAFPDASGVETLAIAGSVEKRADPGLSGVARCLLQSYSQAHAPGDCLVVCRIACGRLRHPSPPRWRCSSIPRAETPRVSSVPAPRAQALYATPWPVTDCRPDLPAINPGGLRWELDSTCC